MSESKTYKVTWEIDWDSTDGPIEAAAGVWHEIFGRRQAGPDDACTFTIEDENGIKTFVDLSQTPSSLNKHHWQALGKYGYACLTCGLISEDVVDDNLCPGENENKWHGTNTDDDFTIVFGDDYRAAVIDVADYGKLIHYDDLYPENTDFESRVEQDYFDGASTWALDQDIVYAYLKARYDH